MKRVLTLVACAALLSSTVRAEQPAKAEKKTEKKPEAKAPAGDGAKEMEAVIAKYSTPGEQHKKLEALVGNWTAAAKFWMGPGKPVESTGTAEIKAVLGGRFYQETYSGTFMGKPFSGMGMTGFDLVKNKYVTSWTDTMTTWMENAEGTADAAGKVITMTSQGFDFQTQKPKTTKWVIRIESDKKHVTEFYETVNGKEMKTGEVVYTRK
jgi:hypothetical protein